MFTHVQCVMASVDICSWLVALAQLPGQDTLQ